MFTVSRPCLGSTPSGIRRDCLHCYHCLSFMHSIRRIIPDISISTDLVCTGRILHSVRDCCRVGFVAREVHKTHLGSRGVHSRAMGTWFQMLPTSSISERSSTSLPGAISRPMSPAPYQSLLRPHLATSDLEKC